ncbi:pentapeptide repeat-containing protein [Streptomyces misionensis]|uniref:pentapeptide repeat-containing protein n=1 Tax=Streptomyces TaxID=1883 RepID=UPI001CED06C3|nr:pentapeptide repeat-containing protein [Streptomyces spinosus]
MVVEVLAAFIRENAPEPDPANPLYLEDGRKYRPPECVQAALTVLGRRPQRPEPFQIDLKRTDLRGADLAGARLDGACLVKASLRTADLKGASLVGAELRRARLEGADLTGADLTEADVGRAHFRSAHLTNATLSTTRGLTVDQLLQVYKLPGVRLPDELASDARIVAKMTK